MSDKRQFVVIGMGRFGRQVALTLTKRGLSVLAIDKDRTIIEDIKDEVSHAAIADSTEEDSLKALGVNEFDVAIVSIGEGLENNILTTAILKNFGINEIIVRSTSKLHENILWRIGATKVIMPEEDMGRRIANSIAAESIIDNIEFSEGYSIAQVKSPANIQGKSLIDANLRAKYNINVVAIKKLEGEENEEPREKIIVPGSDYILKEDDILIVVGTNDDINNFGSM
ncbi:MAG: potassium uptake system protein [Candidatus Muiribacterium halophilum]|uniref:Potassium uptake system protein n=2 Tax=Muiribacterium halophilum TaxID=2053465 RepID=A0A2N5ZK06_MUIH1|nr:MAG: potassium uptake system protein [Candidatus Muirbacterium halophilum]